MIERLEVGCWYRIRCQTEDWGIAGYGKWKFLYISGNDFCFQDENNAKLVLPREPHKFAPSDPWVLELVQDCTGD